MNFAIVYLGWKGALIFLGPYMIQYRGLTLKVFKGQKVK